MSETSMFGDFGPNPPRYVENELFGKAASHNVETTLGGLKGAKPTSGYLRDRKLRTARHHGRLFAKYEGGGAGCGARTVVCCSFT